MCLTRPLSILFQTKTLDLGLATNKVIDLKTTLKNKRRNAQSELESIFGKALKVIEILY